MILHVPQAWTMFDQNHELSITKKKLYEITISIKTILYSGKNAQSVDETVFTDSHRTAGS